MGCLVSGLTAFFLNDRLTRRPEQSHTQGLIDISQGLMEKPAVTVEVLCPVEEPIAYGVPGSANRTEHDWAYDHSAQSGIHEQVEAALMRVITGPAYRARRKVARRARQVTQVISESAQRVDYR
nr:hypothetical protein [Gammaproteobacteria bacterium]